jgi:hypothetical protein
VPPDGGPGLVGHLRARALAAGAVIRPYETEALEVSQTGKGVAVTLGGDRSLEAGLLVSGWPVSGLAPRATDPLGTHLARLAAIAAPARWAARLVLTVPRQVLPVGLGRRVVLDGEPGPLLLAVYADRDDTVRLAATLLVDRPAADPGLANRIREHVGWLVPFLPAEAPAAFLPPDPRWPVRFRPARLRPVVIPPLPGRRVALVGPDVAPRLGPEGEILAALAVAGALAR